MVGFILNSVRHYIFTQQREVETSKTPSHHDQIWVECDFPRQFYARKCIASAKQLRLLSYCTTPINLVAITIYNVGK